MHELEQRDLLKKCLQFMGVAKIGYAVDPALAQDTHSIISTLRDDKGGLRFPNATARFSEMSTSLLPSYEACTAACNEIRDVLMPMNAEYRQNNHRSANIMRPTNG